MVKEVSVRHESQGLLNWGDFLIRTKESLRTHNNALLHCVHKHAHKHTYMSARRVILFAPQLSFWKITLKL